MFRKGKKGFTLIELLVVIAIIGLLSTLTIVALNQARSKARDTRRVSDMKQLVTAMEMYYDLYGEYPPLVDNDGGSGLFDFSSDGTFMPNLKSSGLISQDYKDPLNSKSYFYYYYISKGSTYLATYCPNGQAQAVLHFALENNATLTGFAAACTYQSATAGYIRCICFY